MRFARASTQSAICHLPYLAMGGGSSTGVEQIVLQCEELRVQRGHGSDLTAWNRAYTAGLLSQCTALEGGGSLDMTVLSTIFVCCVVGFKRPLECAS